MRVGFFVISIILFSINGVFYPYFPVTTTVIFIPLAFLFVVGLYDCIQTRHAVLKNFPVIGHFRYILEDIRPEIQQYFIEDNESGKPISRNIRSVVYQRSKSELQTQPYGTQRDVYAEGNEWTCHSMYPTKVRENWDRIKVGGDHCTQPYMASRLNISAMSYGSMSAHAVEALNLGAKQGGFLHNTGEGGIAPYHLKGGDLVWQLGTGYFGCCVSAGEFSAEKFAEKSKLDSVKMIEIKLSQGAKPGKGGMLPAPKVTKEIAEIRGVPIGKDVISPSGHSAFKGPDGLMEFVQKLRELSGGKPVGFKLCIGHQQEFLDLVEAMKKSSSLPDFIVIDGSEGGTGAAPIEFANSVGMPLKDGLFFAHSSLVRAGLRQKIRLIASGKSFTGFDMILNFALGADMVNSARGMMLALGCIQALRCHSNHCPVGICTNDPGLMAGLVVRDKSPRVANYHAETIKSVGDMLSAMGKIGPEQVTLRDLYRRMGTGHTCTFEQIYDPDGDMANYERAEA